MKKQLVLFVVAKERVHMIVQSLTEMDNSVEFTWIEINNLPLFNVE
jgi:hypothetical protein